MFDERKKGEKSMNLLTMSPEEKLKEIRAAKARIAEEHMGNDPVSDDADYLDFIIEGYEMDKAESEA